ncbi:MAG: T9SS type A sorting domain-containing protein [Candidatus Latescibacterota bacterium]
MKRQLAGMLLVAVFMIIMTGNVFADVSTAQGVQKETQTATIMTVTEAAALGIIHHYCYIWDGRQYIPIRRASSNVEMITTFSGFWVIVYQDLDLLIPNISTSSSRDMTLSYTLKSNTMRFFALPVDPGPGNRGVEANLGDDLGPGLAEQKWRVSKWQCDQGKYIRFGVDPFPDMNPGSGFWVQQVTGSDKVITVSGKTVVPPDGFHAVKLPKIPGRDSYHMVGNPYWYNIKWENCKVRVPMTASLPIAKPAAEPEDIKSWYVGLAVETLDGSAVDSYNRAGLIETPGVDSNQYCAFDMLPMENYVNLALKNPSNAKNTLYAYDFRAAGANTYVWDVVLRTSFEKTDVKLSLENLDAVPQGYTFTLTDPSTGKPLSLAEGIILSLSRSASKVLTLTAVKTESTGIGENNAPAAFGITAIHPNPFNPATTIDYTVPASGMVKVQVYNLNGQLIATIDDGLKSAGRHSAVWNAGGNASGVYIVQVTAGEKRNMRKITLVK